MSRQTEPKSIEQGANEVIGYQITCSPAPASVVAVVVIDEIETDNWGVAGESITVRRARGT